MMNHTTTIGRSLWREAVLASSLLVLMTGSIQAQTTDGESMTAAGLPAEGRLDPFVGEAKFESQPLFRGGGLAANRAPIVVARIDTERSFFQYKDSVQELVRSVDIGPTILDLFGVQIPSFMDGRSLIPSNQKEELS